jgi:lipid-A-disaccharide synthase
VLVSAGEASGELYAAELIRCLASERPDLSFFGCAGPKMSAAGVEPVVHASSLAVVGLIEVVAHIPRIHAEFRKLLRAVDERKPRVAILTDSPDFNLRLAKQLKRRGIRVIYLVAPQVWAWREGRVKQMRRDLDHLLCIFPFEEPWFRQRGVRATYIGHPLTRSVRTTQSREEFFQRHHLVEDKPVVALLPGSRPGEVFRHLPIVQEAAARLAPAQCILALADGFQQRTGADTFRERISGSSIQVIEGETSDALAYADIAIAASGTVTVEAALFGTPMVTFYRVASASWLLGRRLVRVPFLTMVNLIAGRRIVPELMQREATGDRLAAEAMALLQSPATREEMKRDLAGVAEMLSTPEHPIQRAARIALEYVS